jgi:hypothetical protein
MAPRANRWTDDEPDGSAFHEIIMLPTLAPQLARPQHLVPYFPVPAEGPPPVSSQTAGSVGAMAVRDLSTSVAQDQDPIQDRKSSYAVFLA